jgi:hypothetical protein
MNQASTLPFAADRAKADAERYRRIFVTTAQHAQVIAEASAVGALTHNEALAAMRRHALNLSAAVEALAKRGP